MAISRYITFHTRDNNGGTADFKIRIAGTDMSTDLPTPAQAAALAALIFGADKLAFINVDGYTISHFDDSLVIVAATNASLASQYWKVLVDQGANDFTFRIPGARTDTSLRQGTRTTYANTGNAVWAAAITALQTAPWEVSNPDPLIPDVTSALISGAQFKDSARKAPRENIGVDNS